jgi:hypothetical protein
MLIGLYTLTRPKDQHHLNFQHINLSCAIPQVILATECAKWMGALGQQSSALRPKITACSQIHLLASMIRGLVLKCSRRVSLKAMYVS